MRFWDSLAGMISVELTSPDFEAMFKALNENRITVLDVSYINALTLVCTIYRQDYKALCKVMGKRSECVKIIRKRGAFWRIISIRNRFVLAFGALLITVMTLILPTKILFVRVEGNALIPEKQILEAAERCGIRFGVNRKQIRSEVFKNRLLEELSQLQWAGVNTNGCTAIISVQERAQKEEPFAVGQINHIVAAKDGIVNSITVLKGDLKCTLGQAVKTGDLLVSAYTDCGMVIKATGADAEIYGDTIYDIFAIMPDITEERGSFFESGTRYSLILGKKLINLSQDSGISGATCVKMYKRYYMSLPGGFQIPVGLLVERLESYEISQNGMALSVDVEQFSGFTENYLKQQMASGSIIDSDYIVERIAEASVLNGRYFCSELIGRIQLEENVEHNE